MVDGESVVVVDRRDSGHGVVMAENQYKPSLIIN